MPPNFDQQALALGLYCTCHDAMRHGAPGQHDTFCYIRRVSEALRAAYRAGQVQMKEKVLGRVAGYGPLHDEIEDLPIEEV